jgi:hypothetical protein
MLFLLTAFALESRCKSTNIILTGKIINGNSRSFAVIHVERKRPRIGRIQRIIRAIRAIRVREKDGVDIPVSPIP